MKRILAVLASLALALPGVASAQVAISALPAASTPSGTEVLPIVQGGVTKKATINQVRGTGGGTVTSVSVVSANGLGGSVATSTTTPAITLSTSITGVLKGNGTAISAATSGTDYAPATSGSSLLYGNGSGGFSNATVGSGLSFSAGTLSATGGALTLISEVVTSGSAANVSFTSIPATYRDLEIAVRGRCTVSATNCHVQMRFNGDTGANYDTMDLEFSQSGAAPGEGIAGTSITAGYLAGSTAPSNVADFLTARIGDYRGTTFQKAMTAQGSLKIGSVTTNFYVIVTSGWWRSTSAITQVDVFPASNGFVDGTVVSLYGRM